MTPCPPAHEDWISFRGLPNGLQKSTFQIAARASWETPCPQQYSSQCGFQDCYKYGLASLGALSFPFSADPRAHYFPQVHRAGQDPRLGQDIGGRFRLCRQLGTGAYGIVYLAWDLVSGQKCAVKSLNRVTADGKLQDMRALEFQAREIRAHWKVQEHPNVVSMFGIVQDPDCIYVILEYCEEGDLFQNITECDKYVGNDELVGTVFDQILDAVDHCHSKGIYHRDLKPENILVADHGNQVKLADFGLAIEHQVSDDYGCGSTFYMSPECLDQAPRRDSNAYDCAPNDVWSLGVILVNLTCGRNPWKEASLQDATYQAFLRDPSFLKTILPITDELNNILRKVFEREPSLRITIPALRREIAACQQFTIHIAPGSMPLTPPRKPVSPAPEEVQEGYNDSMDSDPGSPVSSASDTDSEPSLADFSDVYSRTASPLSSGWQDLQGWVPEHQTCGMVSPPPSPPWPSRGTKLEEDGDMCEISQPQSPPQLLAVEIKPDIVVAQHKQPRPKDTRRYRDLRYVSEPPSFPLHSLAVQ